MANRNRKPQSKGRNGRKPMNRKDDFDKRKECDTQEGKNDPAWYATDAAVLRDAANIPFSWATGTEINTHNALLDYKMENQPTIEHQPGFFAPGIHALYLVPTIGYANSPASPVNIAASATYSFVRHANSGHANYDAPDLMLYIMALSDVYSYINYLIRAYGTATLYSQRNRYMPTALLTAMGINAEDVCSNLADFRYGINLLINKAASLAAPANMTLFNRRAFLYQYIYTEGTSAKDQLYMYVPKAFGVFTESTDPDGAGSLSMVELTNLNELATMKQLLQYGDAMLAPILQSEDMNIMSGDILKAYGDGGIMKMSSLPTEYTVVPVFNIGVLEQMKNATVIPMAINQADVYQDPLKGFLTSSLRLEDSDAAGYGARLWVEDRLLTTTTFDVTPELVIESSRLMVACSIVEGSTDWVVQLYPGSEVAVDAVIFTFDYNTASTTPTPQLAWTSYNAIYRWNWEEGGGIGAGKIATANSMLQPFFKLLDRLGHFRFHPIVEIFNFVEAVPFRLYTKPCRIFDLDNYAVLSQGDLQKMHEAALLNMLHVPSIGKLS